MNKKLSSEWIMALRSNKYKQGIGQLIKDDKYCCLGVLCKIYGMNVVNISIENDREGFLYEDKISISHLPGKFRDEIGMNNEEESKFTYLNDIDRKNFNEIADYIEINIGE